MSVYAISDLHLSMSKDKPMDIFGAKWDNYMERIKDNWEDMINENDYVIIPGDISWATYIEEAFEDFNFINKLPGKKIISKGNHDYWWSTINKLEKYLDKNNFNSIKFLNNNSFQLENILICGSRGWKCPGDETFNEEDSKIYNREVNRLKLSIESGKNFDVEEICVMLHFPPFNNKRDKNELIELMNQYNINRCFYGHLHGNGFKNAFQGEMFGIDFKLISADFLDFKPIKIR